MESTLAKSQLFPTLSTEQLRKLSECGTQLQLQPGEILFAEGDLTYYFYVVLSGEIKITKTIGEEELVIVIHQPGEFTGELGMLMGEPCKATGRSVGNSTVLKIKDFKQLLTSCPQSVEMFVPTLAERSKELEVQMRQQEKLAALGRLSAGLAHELNNPAAAGKRAAQQLHSKLQNLQNQMLSLRGEHFSDHERQWLKELQQEAALYVANPSQLDPLAQSDYEDELADWLEEQGIDDGWQLAPTLVGAGIRVNRLQGMAEKMQPQAFAEGLIWLEGTLMVNGLVSQVEHSTSRISELVQAIKNYSYMDQASWQEIDLNQGLENTLIMLHHKLKYGVKVKREYDQNLPKIMARGGELSQVWTNLIDNAVDAMDGKGELTVRTTQESNQVLVEIIDSGLGIPLEIQAQIFEPFFTSKGIGKGTGLGLDIVRRIIVQTHKGNIRFDSAPGRTCFQVRLPIEQ